MKRNQGITLIALIITIILLLILVGVSLNLLLKGDLFGNAEKAVSSTNAKVEEQQTRVDELMDRMDRASVFAEGTKPTLKYKVYGDDILVYLEHSFYDYISEMSIEEKEESLARSMGYSTIEEFIDGECDGSRRYYELELARRSGSYFNYEEALNFFTIDRLFPRYYSQWLCLDFAENVLHIKNNLSVSEKEKKIASITGWSLTQVGVRMQEGANELGVSYSKVLDMYLNMIEMEELGEEEMVQANETTLTLPTGESGPFYYGADNLDFISGEKQSYVKAHQGGSPALNSYTNYFGMFITNVTNSGRYTYTAENYKGTKAEVTVPVELIRANFKIKVSDTETRTYEFIQGQSWGQFIGEENYIVMKDNYCFWMDGAIGYAYDDDTEPTEYCVCTKQSGKYVAVIVLDAISSSITYELNIPNTVTDLLDFVTNSLDFEG